MNKTTTIFAIAITVSFLGASAQAQVVELENIQGKDFQKIYPVEDKGDVAVNVPLTAEPWTVVRGNTFTTSNTNTKMKEIYLASMEKPNLKAFIYLRARVNNNNARWTDEPCKEEDFLYKNDYSTKLWDQRCLTIRQTSFLQTSSSKPQQIAREFFASREVRYAKAALNVAFTAYTRNGKFLHVSIAIFPTNYGLEEPSAASSVNSNWHLTNFKNDPQKVRFVKELAEWAERYSETAYQNFEDGKQRNGDIPAFQWQP